MKELISSIFKAIKIGLQSITGILQIIDINITEKQLAIIIISTFALLGLIIIIRKKCKR